MQEKAIDNIEKKPTIEMSRDIVIDMLRVLKRAEKILQDSLK